MGAGANFSLCSGSFYQARIKAKAIAINTFIPKNGYRPVEVNPYAQQRYTSYYIPPVYSPQQQFPLYSLITPQAWSATHSFIDPALVRMSYCVFIGFGKEEVKQVLSCVSKTVNSQLFLDLRLNQYQQISTRIKFSYLCLILTFSVWIIHCAFCSGCFIKYKLFKLVLWSINRFRATFTFLRHFL